MARKLAGLLASAPVISWPVVRLIRETMLKDSQQVHVAEVFLGGLLKSLKEIEVDTEPDYVQYGFIDGVRELLVDSVPSIYVLNVVEEVSKFVAKKLGLSLEEFAAVLRNPELSSDSKVVEQVILFAMITAKILRQLGGEYVRVAEQLDNSRSGKKEKAKPTQKISPKSSQSLKDEKNKVKPTQKISPKFSQSLSNEKVEAKIQEALEKQVSRLDLRNDEISSIPESIGKLTNLTSLSLSGRQLETVPESISKLTKLTSLYLSGGQLETVPESISKLTKLTSLYLSVRQLRTVPESIGNFTNLTRLYMR